MNNFLDLTPHEKNVLLPLVVKALQHRETKFNGFSNTEIRNVLKDLGEHTSDGQIRKLIYNIRNNGIIELLIANNQDGYFIANNIQDIRNWIGGHKSKMASMQKTLESIESQFESNMSNLINGESGLIGQLCIFDLEESEESEGENEGYEEESYEEESNTIKTLDDIKDLSIIIVDKMVEENIIKDCTDTDDQTECNAQDIIREILCNKLNIKND